MQQNQQRQHHFYHLQNIKQPHHPAAIPTVAVYPTSTPMMTTGGNNNVATRRDATNNTWLLNQQRHNNNQRGTSRFTVTPTIVQQTTEFTECSKQGTLSPTSNCVSGTAGGGEITPPGSTRPQIPTGVLLKAARDCDDFALSNVLKRGLLVGLPECELNATDSTGRVSTELFGILFWSFISPLSRKDF